MVNLFTLEKKNLRVESDMIIDRSKNNFKSVINESNIDFDSYMNKYKSAIETSLMEANYVYNEHVQLTLKDHCINTLGNIIKTFETSIDILTTYKNILMEEMDYIKKVNKRVIEAYEPLLKRLDRHKFSYQIPEYTLGNLEPEDIYIRVINFIDKKVGLTVFGPDGYRFESLKSVINRYEKNLHVYDEELKREVLGVPNSFNINDFNSIVRSFLVKENNLQTKRIGDELFKTLREIYIDSKSIDNVIQYIQKEIFDVTSFKLEISNKATNCYIDSIITNALVVRSNMIIKCLEYIEDIIKMKIAIFEEMCINYRKVIITGYERISKDPESKEGLYNPHNDEEILEKHSEFLRGHWIIVSK